MAPCRRLPRWGPMPGGFAVSFAVSCERCGHTSEIGALELLLFQFPIGFWLPRPRYDRRMTCPACRRRAWCGVTPRRQ